MVIMAGGMALLCIGRRSSIRSARLRFRMYMDRTRDWPFLPLGLPAHPQGTKMARREYVRPLEFRRPQLPHTKSGNLRQLYSNNYLDIQLNWQ
jgi:hypothetical protein